MDFSLNEEQEAVRDLATRIFEGQATPDRVKEVEGGTDRFDRSLWAELAKANLLGICLPEDVGGSGFGILELCLLLEQQGRRVAPVPLLPTMVGALAIAEHGSVDQRNRWLPGVIAGDVVLGLGLEDGGEAPPVAISNNGGWRLDGTVPAVPGAHLASAVLIAAVTPAKDDGLFLVVPGAGVELVRAETTNREVQPHVVLRGAQGERVGGSAAVDWTRARAVVGLCAIQVGVTEEALRMAAAYTSERHQFGRPLATFQGAALKAADAYIGSEAIRVSMWQAAWRLAQGSPAAEEVMVAKWWASEAGQQVVHITQHLHGGIGADVEYPVHRYFLWGKQIENTLGGASRQLANLGQRIAERA
jgi:acyl-CoA dehydrogenase